MKNQYKSASGTFHSFIKMREHEVEKRCLKFGSLHPLVAESLTSLGLAYHHVTNEHEKALNCHLAAAHILYTHGVESDKKKIAIAVTKTDIGNVLWALGEHEKASLSFTEALSILRSANLGSNHPRVISVENRLQLILRQSI